MIIARNWDWEALFKPFASRNVKHFTRPLAWQYTAAEEPGTCAGARYKDWGDASQYWLGEEGRREGASIEFLQEVPDTSIMRPAMLPLLDCVSGKLQEDMDKLSQGAFFGLAEKQQLKTFIETKGDLAALVTVTGPLDADMMPGRPGYFSCPGRMGQDWKCPVQLIDQLPDDMWGLPASRATAVASHLHLTEEESALLCRSVISSARPTASHPRNFPGGRAMSTTEARQYGSIGSRSKVADFFLSASADELTETALDIFVVQDLKDFLMQEVGIPLNMLPPNSLS